MLPGGSVGEQAGAGAPPTLAWRGRTEAVSKEVRPMDLTTLLIILLVVVVLGGGGWGYRRYRR